MIRFEQGDILAVEKISEPVLVVSKNFFNKTEQAIVCPISREALDDPLHIDIKTDEITGKVMCEHMKLIDLRYRGYKIVSLVGYSDIMNITDAIQGIFDYYPINK